MAKTIYDSLNELLKNDPEFRAEWEASEPERRAMLEALEKESGDDTAQHQGKDLNKSET